jgi:hypothetical protein
MNPADRRAARDIHQNNPGKAGVAAMLAQIVAFASRGREAVEAAPRFERLVDVFELMLIFHRKAVFGKPFASSVGTRGPCGMVANGPERFAGSIRLGPAQEIFGGLCD